MDVRPLYPGFRNPLLGVASPVLPLHVAIVGAGTIGPDIGYYLKSALPQVQLTLVDVDDAPLAAAVERFQGYAAKAVQRGKMTAEKAERVLGGVVASDRLRCARRRRPGDRGRHRGHPLEAAHLRHDRGAGGTRCGHHLEHQLHPGRSAVHRDEPSRSGHRDALLRPRMAQPGGRSRDLGGRRAAHGRLPALALRGHRQGADGHRRQGLLHAGPHLRQLGERVGLHARRRQRDAGRQGRRGVRGGGPVLGGRHVQRQPHHRRDEHAADGGRGRVLSPRSRLQERPPLGGGEARRRGRRACRGPRAGAGAPVGDTLRPVSGHRRPRYRHRRRARTQGAYWRWASSGDRSP